MSRDQGAATGWTGRIKVVRGGKVEVYDMPIFPGSETPSIDWSSFRKCPVCSAETGSPCLSLSGLTAAGPVAVEAPAPHSSRKPRSQAAA